MGRSTATLQAAPRAAKLDAGPQVRESHRDTVEAIVVAFILALVVRSFEAQAFVIPTGSMAPTLMGRHKEIACPQCGFVYAVNASQEAEIQGPVHTVYSGICVNCRNQTLKLDAEPSFKGDRILVSMFPYDLPFLPGSAPPERWDVVVFRYPEEPEVSYIKRLVGLPDETIRIHHGDVFVKSEGSDRFTQARKPIRHQTATQITVYDDRYRPRALSGKIDWQRWRAEKGWKTVDPQASHYRSEEGQNGEWAELRYRHLVPDPEQWEAIQANRSLPSQPRATLITDFYSYNTNMTMDYSNLLDEDQLAHEGAWMQPHWVGDLSLDANLEITSVAPDASLRLELVKAGLPHRCTIDLNTGTGVVTRGKDVVAKWETPIKGAGRYHVQFSNVDERIIMLIDGKEIGGEGISFESKGTVPIPTAADLAPAAIAVRNASVEASDLVLKRDIYYTQVPGYVDYGVVWEDRRPQTPKELFDFLSDTARFPALANVRASEYKIGPDRFFMLGDNSPCSKDSRGWGRKDAEWDPSDRQKWEVPRSLVTGKAFYVYWPHGVPFWPKIGTHDFRIPFRPYFERMKWIR